MELRVETKFSTTKQLFAPALLSMCVEYQGMCKVSKGLLPSSCDRRAWTTESTVPKPDRQATYNLTVLYGRATGHSDGDKVFCRRMSERGSGDSRLCTYGRVNDMFGDLRAARIGLDLDIR